MKKLTLLNFPAHFYTPQLLTAATNDVLQLEAEKQKIIQEDRIARLLKRQIELEAEVDAIPSEYKDFDKWVETEKHAKELKDIDSKFTIDSLGNKNWKLWNEARRKEEDRFEMQLKEAEMYSCTLWALERNKENLKNAEELSAKDMPYLPTPLTQDHIDLINIEIAKMALEGYEMEKYELLQTSHTTIDNGVLQKFYSGVLLTWIEITDNRTSEIQSK